MPTDLPLLALIALAATAVAVAVLRRTSEHVASGRPASQAHRPGIFAGMADLVDASIGMYMARRMLGRPTTTRADSRADRARTALAAAEDERRRRAIVAGPSIVAPTRLVVAGTAASHAPRELRDRQAHPVAVAPQAPAPRGSAVPRQGAFAAVGLIAVLVAVFAMWPRPDGAVLSVTGTAAPSASVEPPTSTSPPPTTEAPTAEPTDATTPSPSATPTAGPTATPTAAPTPTPAATRTPRPTARPTNTPRPTARPTPAPTATATAGPTPTPDPTPTPEPTPTPTPTPTAEPTPEPTPVPTPTPDPTPAP